MEILVTGGAGFIGGHLVKTLQKEGHKVTTMDINNAWSIDVSDRVSVHSFFKLTNNFDAIYHLAAKPWAKVGDEADWLRRVKTFFPPTS